MQYGDGLLKFSAVWKPVTVKRLASGGNTNMQGFKIPPYTEMLELGCSHKPPPQRSWYGFWEVCLRKYRTPTTRTILLKVCPIKALQGVINKCKMFITALMSLQNLPCTWTKFQWARLHLLIHPFPMKWQLGNQTWEPLKPLTTYSELCLILGVPLTGPMFLNSLSPRWKIQFFIHRGAAKHRCVSLCVHGLSCAAITEPSLSGKSL